MQESTGDQSSDQSERASEDGIVTNWVTSKEGDVLPSEVRLFPGNGNGVYEIEYRSEMVGLSIGSDFDTQYIVIESVSLSSPLAKSTVSIGDILVAVNARDVIYEELEDVIEFIHMIKMSTMPCRLRFINPSACSVTSYEKKMNFRKKSQKDMYGFIRSTDYLVSERLHWSSRIGVHAQLDLDWIEYLKSIGGPANLKPYGTFKPSLELKTLVRRGIPVALRPLIWPFISRTDVYRRGYSDNYYESLILRAESDLDPKVKDDIEKDLHRTFPGHDYFNTAEAIICLRRVLTAFALKNEHIGYCQSLNFMAGAMLLFMEEESAFWMMCHVIEKLLPPDYYTATMIGTYVDQFVLAYLIKTTLPKLHVLLQSFEMQLPLVAVEWFMCLFVNTLRPEVAFRVWDILLNEGAKTLFRIAMALLKRHEPELLKATDGAMLFMTIKEIGIDIVDPDELIELAYKTHRRPTATNYSSTKISNILSTNGVGPAPSSMVLKRNPTTAMKSVPRDLVGIGLAHLGPKALYNKFSATTVDVGMATYVMNVISGHRRPSFESSEALATANGTGSIAKSDSTTPADDTTTVELAESSAPPNPTTVDPLDASEHALHAEVKTSEVAPGTSRPRKKRDAYRNFGTIEIISWREQFRPEVEARILSMENARLAYKRRRDSLDCGEPAPILVSDPVGTTEVDSEVIEEPGIGDTGSSTNDSMPRSEPSEKNSTATPPRSPHINIPINADDDDCDDDDGVDYDMIRRDSMSMSPDEKMHNAAPKLWNMLFQENGDAADLPGSSTDITQQTDEN